MPYSLDLRKRAIDFIEQGGSISKAAQMYQISRATIYRWLSRADLAPTRVTRRQRKLDWNALRKDVEENPESKLAERARKFGVRTNAIFYASTKMKIARKKRLEIQGEKPRGKDSILSCTQGTDATIWQ